MKRGMRLAAIVIVFNLGAWVAAPAVQQNSHGATIARTASYQQPQGQAAQAVSPATHPATPATQSGPNSQQNEPGTAAATTRVAQASLGAAQHVLSTVVLDAGHGGSDTGARGTDGVVEKDIALIYARAAKIELEKLGFHVVMTRQADEDPSLDERAMIANAQRDAVLVTFHVSSTGPVGTVRTYFYDFGFPAPTTQSVLPAANPSGSAPAAPVGNAGLKPANASVSQANPSLIPLPDVAVAHPAHGFVPWDQAQEPYVNASHQLGDLVQGEMAKAFKDSQQLAIPVPERDLRSIAAPAVAVEVSSVDVKDPLQLTSIAGTLGQAVARGVAAFRPIYDQSVDVSTKN